MAGIHKSAVKIEILPVDLITGFNPKISKNRRSKTGTEKKLCTGKTALTGSCADKQ
jgi:hypothetical protein